MTKFIAVSDIKFIKNYKAFYLPKRTDLKSYIARLFKKEAAPLSSLNYIFCSDNLLLDINRQFLKHDFYTDIITFNLAGPKDPIQGEIYISIDRVKDNARLLNEFYSTELHRVIFHGALHLCGYNDKTSKDREIMRRKEDECLRYYFK